MLNKLTIAAKSELAECESVIDRGKDTFLEVGRALLRIQSGHLYRETHPDDFEGYCRERFGFTGRRARLLIDAAKVLDGLLQSGTTVPLPENERQARALNGLTTEEQIEVLRQAATGNPSERTRAVRIREIAAELLEGLSPEEQRQVIEEEERDLRSRAAARVTEPEDERLTDLTRAEKSLGTALRLVEDHLPLAAAKVEEALAAVRRLLVRIRG